MDPSGEEPPTDPGARQPERMGYTERDFEGQYISKLYCNYSYIISTYTHSYIYAFMV